LRNIWYNTTKLKNKFIFKSQKKNLNISFTIIRPSEKIRTVVAKIELISAIVNEGILNKDEKFFFSCLFIINNNEEKLNKHRDFFLFFIYNNKHFFLKGIYHIFRLTKFPLPYREERYTRLKQKMQ